MTPGTLGLADAAKAIGMSREWLRKQVTSQLVPCTRFGRAVRFTPEQITDIIAAHAQPVAPAIRPRLALVNASKTGPSYPPPQPPNPPGPTSPPKSQGRKASA